MTDHGIKGKTALIAGGAKNLGGLIARDLAAQGAKAIAIHYNSEGTRADADATVAALKAAGAEAGRLAAAAGWLTPADRRAAREQAESLGTLYPGTGEDVQALRERAAAAGAAGAA